MSMVKPWKEKKSKENFLEHCTAIFLRHDRLTLGNPLIHQGVDIFSCREALDSISLMWHLHFTQGCHYFGCCRDWPRHFKKTLTHSWKWNTVNNWLRGWMSACRVCWQAAVDRSYVPHNRLYTGQLVCTEMVLILFLLLKSNTKIEWDKTSKSLSLKSIEWKNW